jgi:hypothetical protein
MFFFVNYKLAVASGWLVQLFRIIDKFIRTAGEFVRISSNSMAKLVSPVPTKAVICRENELFFFETTLVSFKLCNTQFTLHGNR